MSGPWQLRLTILGVTLGAIVGIAVLSGDLRAGVPLAIAGAIALAATFIARWFEPPAIPHLVLINRPHIERGLVTLAGVVAVLFVVSVLVSAEGRSTLTRPVLNESPTGLASPTATTEAPATDGPASIAPPGSVAPAERSPKNPDGIPSQAASATPRTPLATTLTTAPGGTAAATGAATAAATAAATPATTPGATATQSSSPSAVQTPSPTVPTATPAPSPTASIAPPTPTPTPSPAPTSILPTLPPLPTLPGLP